MEGSVGPQSENVGSILRKKRSDTSRRPPPKTLTENHDITSPTPPSDKAGDENTGSGTTSQKKEFTLKPCPSNISSVDRGGDAAASKNMRRSFESQSTKTDTYMSNGKSSESVSQNQNKVTRVKLRVGGVTRTIQTNPTSDGASTGRMLPNKSPQSSDAHIRQNPILKETSADVNPSAKNPSGLQRVPSKHLSAKWLSLGKDDSSENNMPARKSKRVPRRRMLDSFDDDDDDEDKEIQYLEKLRISKTAADHMAKCKENGEGSRNLQQLVKDSKCMKVEGENVEDPDYGSLKSSRDGKNNSRPERVSEDTDYMEEEGAASDGETEGRMRKQKEPVEMRQDIKRETSLTSRQRALMLSKDGSRAPGASSVEFPNGLPSPPSRKQKEKLSEVEQQLKKAEAAQRRKMQVEKAAREAEEEAIRKILCQDSSRKKQENKKKKWQEELAQERAANGNKLAPNTLRWISNPSGTFLQFSEDIGMPSLFDSKPRGYPPPRETCAGPSCTNPYKYRDSKTNVPLCSLQCYKAIQAQQQPASTS